MLVEGLALDLSNLEFEGSGLARAVGTLGTVLASHWFSSFYLRNDKTYSEGTSTPGATTVDLVEVGELGEGSLVA